MIITAIVRNMVVIYRVEKMMRVIATSCLIPKLIGNYVLHHAVFPL